MVDLLGTIGLNGSFQLHLSPVVLIPDERAHQVLRGFGAQTGQVLANFVSRFGEDATVWAGSPESAKRTTLSEAVRLTWADGDQAVIESKGGEFAGGLYGLVQIVDRLLGPGGCPWDQAQTHESLKRHLIEEVYELVEAIDSKNEHDMVEELGDVLLQPLMHAQMEALAGSWDIDHVAAGIADKLVRRHPHVFGDLAVEDADEVLRNWDAIKKGEKGSGGETSILEGVPRSLPALLRAFEVSKRAARSGFEWPNLEGVWEKLDEESRELREAISLGHGIEEEVGDLLFTVVNLARWLKVEPEDALRVMVDRFTARFKAMESASVKPLDQLTAGEWDALWVRAKGR